jgi:hypothetical protein
MITARLVSKSLDIVTSFLLAHRGLNPDLIHETKGLPSDIWAGHIALV